MPHDGLTPEIRARIAEKVQKDCKHEWSKIDPTIDGTRCVNCGKITSTIPNEAEA